jgi:hypothetical protein
MAARATAGATRSSARWSKGLGMMYSGPKRQRRAVRRRGDLLGDLLAGERGEGADGGDLHLLVDGGGPHVEGAAEDEGEAEDVVDLVGVVAAARGHDDVGAGGDGLGVADLGVGVGHRHDDGALGHRADHVGVTTPLTLRAHEDVGADHGVGQGAVRRVHGELGLVGVHAVVRPS